MKKESRRRSNRVEQIFKKYVNHSVKYYDFLTLLVTNYSITIYVNLLYFAFFEVLETPI